jgi:hypothetical protein
VGEERLKNVTNLFLEFLIGKVGIINIVSQNVVVYKNITMTLNEDLLYD